MEISSNSLKLLGMLNADKEKLSRLKSLSNYESIYAYFKTLIPEYTKEEFVEFTKIMSHLCLRNSNHDTSSEMDERELDKISGGGGIDFDYTIKVMNSFDDGFRSMQRTNETILQVAQMMRNITELVTKKMNLSSKNED